MFKKKNLLKKIRGYSESAMDPNVPSYICNKTVAPCGGLAPDTSISLIGGQNFSVRYVLNRIFVGPNATNSGVVKLWYF
jgi:hypothetical protein